MAVKEFQVWHAANIDGNNSYEVALVGTFNGGTFLEAAMQAPRLDRYGFGAPPGKKEGDFVITDGRPSIYSCKLYETKEEAEANPNLGLVLPAHWFTNGVPNENHPYFQSQSN